MFEIEAKVWVKDKKQWLKIKNAVKAKAFFEEEKMKTDSYFGRIGEKNPLFRLRVTNGKTAEVTVKNKIIIKGIEESKEETFEIKNIKAFLHFCKNLGLHILLKKEKKTSLYKQGKIQIELNTVKNLGDFLEIEILCKNKTEIPQAKIILEKTFAEYGFSSQDFEARPYAQLLFPFNLQ